MLQQMTAGATEEREKFPIISRIEGWRDGGGGGREAGEFTVGAYHWPYRRGVRGGRGGGGGRRGGGRGGVNWL